MKDLLNKITLGNSLEIIKNIPDKSIDMILTDPPYLYENQKSFTKSVEKENSVMGKRFRKSMNNLAAADIINSFNIEDYFIEFLRISKKINWAIYCNENQFLEYLLLIKKYNLKFKLLKWIKKNPTPLGLPYLPDTEYCLYIYSLGGGNS